MQLSPDDVTMLPWPGPRPNMEGAEGGAEKGMKPGRHAEYGFECGYVDSCRQVPPGVAMDIGPGKLRGMQDEAEITVSGDWGVSGAVLLDDDLLSGAGGGGGGGAPRPRSS